MPKQSALERQKALAEANAAVMLGEPVICSLLVAGGGYRGLAGGLIAPMLAGSLGDMAGQQIGDAAEHFTEVVVDAAEQAAEGAKKEKGPEHYAYRGSKFIKVKFRRTYRILISASKVGIFTESGKPIVIIPREAIRKAEPAHGLGNFLWSFARYMWLLRIWTLTFDDGGKLNFWVGATGLLGTQGREGPKCLSELVPKSAQGT